MDLDTKKNIYHYLDNLKSKTNNKLSENILFKNLQHISKDDFLKIQKNFIHAINHWPKLLLILCSRINEPELRMLLLDNINDEHGNGNINLCHVNTFHQFLKALGLNPNHKIDLYDKYQSKAVNNFNIRLTQFVNNNDYRESALILGAIEYIYIDISKYFNQYLAKHNLEVYHYTEHEILDVKHADDLFTIALSGEGLMKDDVMNKYLYIGYILIYDLYEELYNENI